MRIEGRIAEQRVGQRFKAGFTGDLRFGAALGFEGQINIFQRLLGGGAFDGGAQFIGELALLFDGRQDRPAPILQLAEIEQPLLEIAQLGVVEIAGDFFAIAGDERHGRPFIQQCDGGGDLVGADAEFAGDQLDDFALASFGTILRHG